MNSARAANVFAGLVLAATLACFVYLWLSAGWMHFELLAISDYLLSKPSTMTKLATILDWRFFEVSSLRLRVLSDAAEVIDAAARPTLTAVTGLSPSVSLLAVPFAIATIAAFYGAARRFGVSIAAALILTAIFISTIGFESCFVAYIRPAKKIALLGICIAMWLILRTVQEKGRANAIWLLGVALLASLADETGLLIFPIAVVFLGAASFVNASARRGLVILLLFPLLYAAMAYGALPLLYQFGVHGIREHAISDPDAWRVLSGITDLRFWMIAGKNLISEVAATLGVTHPWGACVSLFAVVSVAVTALLAPFRSVLAASSLVALGGSVSFASLFDRYNGTEQGNYLGALTYYYHSIVAAMVLFVVAAMVASAQWKEFGRRSEVRIAALALACAVIVGNFVNFSRLNEVVQRIHIYPIEPESIAGMRSVLIADPAARIEVTINPDKSAQRFERAALVALDGRRRPFEATFAMFLNYPFGTESYLRRLVRAFYPERDSSLTLLSR